MLSRHGLFDIWQKKYSLLSVKLNRHSESWLISIYFPCSMWCGKFSSNFFFQFDVSCFILKVANYHLKTECSFGTLLFCVYLALCLDLEVRGLYALDWWLQVKFGKVWSLLLFRICFLLLLICISWFCFFFCWFASSYVKLFPVTSPISFVLNSCLASNFIIERGVCPCICSSRLYQSIWLSMHECKCQKVASLFLLTSLGYVRR